ncbi:MAG: TraR/DksA family transcriptional regulator [Planctomycetaceae bacterium]|jgi:DnaK suppressor protein|nr:TraR/DksA family transcriptional regulator [Planctomycetaceae bacterium]
MKKITQKVAALSEKRLTAAEIDSYKHKLLILRARLSGDVSTMTNAALNKNRLEASGDLSVMPIHMADVGSDNFEQEQTLSFMQSESGILDQVDEALVRIKEGTYGTCDSCGGRIPKVRLNFLPYATLCVQCAENTVQDEK